MSSPPPRERFLQGCRTGINRVQRHKTLRGPRAGLIFFRKDGPNHEDLEKRVNDAVFPACQGGPHNNVIVSFPFFLNL